MAGQPAAYIAELRGHCLAGRPAQIVKATGLYPYVRLRAPNHAVVWNTDAFGC